MGGELFSGRITAEGVCVAHSKNARGKGGIYHRQIIPGVISDVKSIAAVARANSGCPLLVDCAPRSASEILKDISPLNLEAAMSAESAIKTSPVLTGGAWPPDRRRKFCAGDPPPRHGSFRLNKPVLSDNDIIDLCARLA